MLEVSFEGLASHGDNRLAIYIVHILNVYHNLGYTKKIEMCPPSNFFLRPPLPSGACPSLSHSLLSPATARVTVGQSPRADGGGGVLSLALWARSAWQWWRGGIAAMWCCGFPAAGMVRRLLRSASSCGGGSPATASWSFGPARRILAWMG
jgi:hypothetical protein